MEIKKAVGLVSNLMQEAVGPNNMFDSHRDRIQDDLSEYESYDKWLKRLKSRTDLSMDDMWDLECLTEAVKICFELRGPLKLPESGGGNGN